MNLGKRNSFKRTTVLYVMSVMLLITGCLTLTGCTLREAVSEDSDIYQYVKEHTEELQEGTGQAAENGTRRLTQGIFSVSDKLKSSAPIIIIGSILIGIILLFLFNNEQGMRRHAIFVFILGIPIIDLLLVYGTAWLAGWFL